MGEMNSSALAGKRVVVTRAAEQSVELVRELTLRGAVPLILPLVSFVAPKDCAPLESVISQLPQFDWVVFTSANAVRAVAAQAAAVGCCQSKVRKGLKVAAVGPATAEAAEEAGFCVAHVATTHNGVALAHELGEMVRDKKVFLPRSDRANPDLPLVLRQCGAHVSEVIAYRTVAPNSDDAEKWREVFNGGADAILFFSSSAVSHLTEHLALGQFADAQNRMALVAIGPVTAKALRNAGVERMAVAGDATSAAAVEALEDYFAGKNKQISGGVKRG